MNQKHLMTILATITIIATLSVSLFFTQFSAATATTYNADNMTVTGVLASDSYVLFPYTKENLIFGFSKYGELINGVAPKQGLEYDGMDVFANPNVYEKDWSQGWFIDIHYADKDNSYKNVWAFAMYTDLSGSTGIGGDWIENCTAGPTGAPHGGRKTNAWAATDPIKVLYDGPRRFVAVTSTTIYGASTRTADDALVRVTITFVFDKDKKCVILFKDIKRLDTGKWGRTFQVEFSNRGEWDIGTTSAPPSYAHFYDNLTTVYDYEYHDFYSATDDITGFDVAQMINKGGSYVGFAAFWPQLFGKMVSGTGYTTPAIALSSLSTKVYNQTWLALGSPSDGNITFTNRTWPTADPYPRGAGEWSDAPMVFQNGVLKAEGTARDYTWNGTEDKILFTTEPLDTDYITVVYKHQMPTGGGADDMNNYVAEPKTPYVIGEWCFDLADEDYKRQFRAVTVYGLTDRHDADDNNTVAADRLPAGGWSGGADVIDSEVQYYLNETFNPYDLYSAVHKQESRWVDIRTLTATTSSITLTEGLDDEIWCNKTDLAWSGYKLQYESAGSAAEWVNAFEDGATYTANSKNWALQLSANSSGYARVRITPAGFGQNGTYYFGNLTEISFWYKELTAGYYGPHMFVKLSNGTADSWVNIQMYNNPVPSPTDWVKVDLSNIDTYTDQSGADEAFWYDSDAWTKGSSGPMAGVSAGAGTAKHSFDFYKTHLADYYVTDIVVELGYNLAGSTIAKYLIDDIDVGYLTGTDGIRYERVYNMEEDKLIPTDWDAYCSFSEKVLVDGVLIDREGYHDSTAYEPYYIINFETGTITFWHWSLASGYHLWVLPIGTHIKVLYSTIEENEKGRYEWMVAGKGAATVDSLGAAYMTEAFDSIKDIDVLLTGLDINDTTSGSSVPFVMAGATTGTAADYRDTLGRVHLRDDWCTTYPVASSDMLFSGGPGANVGAEYFNEFTNAFWARTEYVVNDTGQAFKIFALSCWNRTSYSNGYATISVYKDLNGTIGFLIWGVTGSDTYYAAKWFWDIPGGLTAPDGTTVYSGIEYLQHENRGVTDIILHITSPTLDPTHPTFSIVQRLGTISEKTPHEDP